MPSYFCLHWFLVPDVPNELRISLGNQRVPLMVLRQFVHVLGQRVLKYTEVDHPQITLKHLGTRFP